MKIDSPPPLQYIKEKNGSSFFKKKYVVVVNSHSLLVQGRCLKLRIQLWLRFGQILLIGVSSLKMFWTVSDGWVLNVRMGVEPY